MVVTSFENEQNLSSTYIKKNVASKDVNAAIFAILVDDPPDISPMQKWAAEFRTGRESLEYDPISGRSSTAITMEKIDRALHIDG